MLDPERHPELGTKEYPDLPRNGSADLHRLNGNGSAHPGPSLPQRFQNPANEHEVEADSFVDRYKTVLRQTVQSDFETQLRALNDGEYDVHEAHELYQALYAVGLEEEAELLRAAFLQTVICADKKPEELILHGDVRIDPYFYMHDFDSDEVQAHLESENAITNFTLADTESRQEELYQDCLANLPPQEETYPDTIGEMEYWEVWNRDKGYPIHKRKKVGAPDEDAEVVLDVNELAEQYDDYYMTEFQLSEDQRFIVFGDNILGDETYTLRVKDLQSGEFLEDTLENCSGSFAFHPNGNEIYYAELDDTHRGYRIRRHIIGNDQSEDQTVYFTDDKRYEVAVWRSLSGRYMFIETSGWEDNETRMVDLSTPDQAPTLIAPKKPGFSYEVTDHEDRLIIRTNKDGAKNYKIMSAPIHDPNLSNWEDLVPYDPEIYIKSYEVSKHHIILGQRIRGKEQVRFISLEDGSEQTLRGPIVMKDGDHPGIAVTRPYHLAFAGLSEYEPKELLITTSSLTQPDRCYAFDPDTLELTLRTHDQYPRYNPAEYVEETISSTAEDGTQVPISIVRPQAAVDEGKAIPIILMAYGSYGDGFEPNFNGYSEETVNDIAFLRMRLLEMGYGVAIAHIRGGDEFGSDWHQQGRRDQKENTYEDYLTCAAYLRDEEFASHIIGWGRSAGGMLMGTSIIRRPDLFDGMVIGVGALDFITSLLDDNLPLSHNERQEFGDPRKPEDYERMKKWSPYDIIRHDAYPPVLITAGVHDSRVHAREPLKFAAKLREHQEGEAPILFTSEFGGPGHFGRSSRLEKLKETALFASYIEKVVEESEQSDSEDTASPEVSAA